MTSRLDAHRVQLVRLLELVQREQARRLGYGGADPREELICQLAEMGRRLTAGNVPAGLAEQLAEAEDWARVDELRIPVDMSPAEAVALAMTVDFEAGVRLLVEYPGSP